MMPPNLPDSSYLYDERWDRLPPDGYYLSSRGRIWSDRYRRFLRPVNFAVSSLPAHLSIRIGVKSRFVAPLARTVLTMFGSPSPGGRSYVCHHKDGDPFNNQVENLEWVKLESRNHKRSMGAELRIRGQVMPITSDELRDAYMKAPNVSDWPTKRFKYDDTK